MKKNVVKDKSFQFAIRVVNCCKFLNEKNEFVLSKQLLKSGTAVGALIRESEMAESKKDFIHKLHIALKEANEASYWISLLLATHQIKEADGNSLNNDCLEIIKLLLAIIKTSKSSL